MSLRTTGMPAELMTWAISPPIVPAPTTAALVTNMAARLQPGFVLSLYGEAAECAFQRLRERAPDEEHVGQPAQRAARRERVVELHLDCAVGEAERLGADQLVLEQIRHEAVGTALEHALGHPATARGPALPHELGARLRPVAAHVDYVAEAV